VRLADGYRMQWLQNVIECSGLLSSFDPRALPPQLIAKELLPKVGEVTRAAESAHPFDGAAFEQTWKFDKSSKVEVVMGADTRMSPADVIIVEGSGGFKRELKGLASGTLRLEDKDKLGGDKEGKVFVGDLVVKGEDWKWGGEDGGRQGVVLGIESWKGEADCGAKVAWLGDGGGGGELGKAFSYRAGFNGKYDVRSVGVSDRSRKPIVVPGEEVTIRVVPGEPEKEEAGSGGGGGSLVLGDKSHGFDLPYCDKIELVSSYTIEMWIKPDTPARTELVQCLIDRTANLAFDGSMTLRQIKLIVKWDADLVENGEEASGHLNLNMGNAEMGTGVDLGVGGDGKAGQLKSGAWTHVAITVGGGEVGLFVNGEIASRGVFEGNRLGAPNNASVAFGHDSDGTSLFKGRMRDLKICGSCKTVEDVRGGMWGGNEHIYTVNLRFDSAEAAVRNQGTEPDIKPIFVGGLSIDAGGDPLPQKSKEVHGWHVQLRPVWAVESVPASEVERLSREYCVGNLKHDEALVKYVRAKRARRRAPRASAKKSKKKKRSLARFLIRPTADSSRLRPREDRAAAADREDHLLQKRVTGGAGGGASEGALLPVLWAPPTNCAASLAGTPTRSA
jgi:hypothetical protein